MVNFRLPALDFKTIVLLLSLVANLGLVLFYLFSVQTYKDQIYRLETNLSTCTENTDRLQESIEERNTEIDRINIEAIERSESANEIIERISEEKRRSEERIDRILRNSPTQDSSCETSMEYLRSEAMKQ